jgi:probable HAF family extracellular repeat protein
VVVVQEENLNVVRRRVWAIAALLGAGCASSAPARPAFELFEPTNGEDCSQAVEVNASGVVVGYSDSCLENPWPNEHQAYPFVADGAGVRPLPAGVAASSIYTEAINDAGFILANDETPPEYTQWLYRPGHWDTPELVPLDFGCDLYALTNRPLSGQALPVMVGCAGAGASGPWQWIQVQTAAPGGAASPPSFIPPPAAGYAGDGGAMAVNDLGDMAGFYTLTSGERSAMAWTREGGLIDLNTLASAGSGWALRMALGINQQRQVVGFGLHGADVRAFRADLTSGTVIDLGALPAPLDHAAFQAHAINAHGHIVGTAGRPADAGNYHLVADRAFFFSDATGLVDLNNLATPSAGWTLSDAADINDADEVVGFATDGNVRRAYRARLTLP